LAEYARPATTLHSLWACSHEGLRRSGSRPGKLSTQTLICLSITRDNYRRVSLSNDLLKRKKCGIFFRKYSFTRYSFTPYLILYTFTKIFVMHNLACKNGIEETTVQNNYVG